MKNTYIFLLMFLYCLTYGYAQCSPDVTPPVIVCPANITVACPHLIGNLFPWQTRVSPTSTSDNCGPIAVQTYTLTGATNLSSPATGINDASNQTFLRGTTTVTYTIQDFSGNSASCSFTVTVNDFSAPSVACPTNLTLGNTPGDCYAEVTQNTLGFPVSFDNCNGISTTPVGITLIDAPDPLEDYYIFPIGTTTVTWLVRDLAGNTNTCTQTVTVTDNEPPSIVCPTNITVNTASGQCDAFVSIPIVTASDNCSIVSIINDFNGNGANASDTYPIGTTTINFTATDSANLTVNCSVNVTVVNAQAPVITLLGANSITMESCGSYIELGATAMDICIGDISSSVIIDVTNLDTSAPGTYTVTYNVTNTAGIAATEVIRTIIVEDTTAPILSLIGPNPLTIGDCSTYTELGVNINDCEVLFGTDVIINSNLDTSTLGVYTVTYDITDSSGNVATQITRTINVIDVNEPIITLLGANPLTIEACSVYTELGATALDPCSNIDYTGAIVIDASAVNTAFIGSYNVTYNVMDVYSNSAIEVIRVVDVVDSTNPQISCPGDVIVSNDVGQCSAIVNYVTPIGTDSCLNATTIQTAGLPSGSVFPVGTTINTFEVTDGVGLTATCSFNVTVSDTENPTITCPSDIVVGNDAGLCSAIVNFSAPVINDNCAGQTTIQTAGLVSGSIFPIGTTVNTYEVTDAEGNRTICSFNITVNDTEIPIALCMDVTLQLDPITGLVSMLPADIDNGSSDNCNFNLMASITSFDCNDIGANSVTLTVTDDAGNSATCIATVTITDLSDNASVSILSSDTQICQDEEVTFTATPTDGGTTPSYQWQVNGIDVAGEIASTFVTTTLLDGDEVTVLMTSSLSICANSFLSNVIIITINVNNADADAGPDFTNIICTNTSLTLAGNAITGAGSTGLWTVTSGQTSGFSFSDATSPTSNFIGDIGETYTLTWSIDNPSPCIDTSDSMTVTLVGCSALDFDGVDDNITFRDNYNVTGDFSIEVWVKSEVSNGSIQTIISKREANNQIDGYDLRLVDNYVSFNWNNGQSLSSSPLQISTDIWHHIALTFNGSTYKLYIDGIEVKSAGGSIPITNTSDCIVGAMEETLTAPFQPLYYFDGGMDELRIWDLALTESQIRKMMNQEIEDNAGNVRGSVVPINISGLSWNNLSGYYQMNQITDIAAGSLIANSTSAINGLLRYMTTLQPESAPLPYQSNADGLWTNSNTWLNGNVQSIPNSLGIDGTTSIDWNIVRTSHIISSGNKDITLLGLDVNVGTLSIENSDPFDGQSIRVTDYLILNGTLDLVGESQLLQDTNSLVDYAGIGNLQRDQKGTSNLFNYNYWGSPVSINGIGFSVGGVLNDGSTPSNPQSINWVGSYNATGSTNPISLSTRWIYTYEDTAGADYFDWVFKGQNNSIDVGLGFTLKGSGVGDPVNDKQNYVFIGHPNNGDISLPITANYQALVGNPYPSAIDANQFIIDNGPSGTNAITGPLFFWEHSTTNNSHVLSEYEGGYATYSLSGGVAAVTPPTEIGGLGTVNKIPRQYIPIAQGFYATSSASGGTIEFNNNQRIFVKESSGNSIFLRHNQSNLIADPNEVQRIRLNVTFTDGSIRPLLLAFTPNGEATEGIDFGYDAENTDEFPNDAAFMIDNRKFVIQGVGHFNAANQYSLGLFLSNSGTIEISLMGLENFDAEIDVFVYDALMGTSTQINNTNYTINLMANDYPDRFFITFEPKQALSIPVSTLDLLSTVIYLVDSNELFIQSPNIFEIKAIYLFNIIGQKVKTWASTHQFISNNALRIPVKNLAEGAYIVKIETTANDNFNKKVLIKY